MARRTKAQIAAHSAEQNALAAAIPTGTTVDMFPFGDVVLGERKDIANAECDGQDTYWVHHSGFKHCWSAAAVVASFPREV